MQDPVAAFEQVRDKFTLYIKTAFGTKFPGLELERERLLRHTTTFSREQWIEPLPRYESSTKSIHDLDVSDVPGLDREALDDFKVLASCGLVEDFPLYRHQMEMLQKSLSGQNTVVTSGTGSGKTEAFLLPLFAYLAKESRHWPAPGAKPEHCDDWWSNLDWQQQCIAQAGTRTRIQRSYRIPQRGHETRDAAVRALVLYPMNALVEDQLTRLRRALDSPAAREWFSAARRSNRLYFGRYNSSTPIAGHEYNKPGQNGNRTPDRDRIEKLAKELRASDRAAQYAQAFADSEGANDDVVYFFPRLDGAEMRSRWDMQDSPPDILITNFSMLSIMMMREADQSIFEKTREWLEKDESIFHLIVDELHLHRGTAGTEVAYLLRLLLLRLGLTPTSPKLRVLASSASLERDDPDSLRFLSEFFGSNWRPEHIVPGYPKPVGDVQQDDELPTAPFITLAEAYQDPSAVDGACSLVAEALGDTSAHDLPRDRLQLALETSNYQIGARMLAACKIGEETRAVSLLDFSRGIFGPGLTQQELDMATRGLLIARALCDPIGDDSSLPSFRLHWFFRNIEGLWGCTVPNCQCAPDEQDAERTVGKLFGGNRILCGGPEAHRVLELLYCEQCGTTFFGGSRYRLPANGGWELLSTDPELEGVPDRQAARFVERRTYREFAVFWAVGRSNLNTSVQPWRQPSRSEGQPSAQATWSPAALDTKSARVVLTRPGQTLPTGTWTNGYLFHLPATQNEDEQENFGALPSVCPSCSANYTRGVFRKSPVRGFRTGFSKVSQLLAKELFYLLPERKPKLVVFSDSREDAASISNGIERSHYADLLREAMYDELRNIVLGQSSLLADLENFGEPRGTEALAFAATDHAAIQVLNTLIRNAARNIPEGLDPEDRELLKQRRTSARQVLDGIRQRAATRMIPLRVLFESPDGALDPRGTGLLIQRMKALGVNPAGNDILYQDFKYDGSYRHWTSLFDFSSTGAGWREGLSAEAATARDSYLRSKVISEVCGVLFSRNYFGFESAGLGYSILDLTPEHNATIAARCACPPEVFRDICNACLRIMGDLYRYPPEPANPPLDSWPDWDSARAHLRNYARRCAAKIGLNEDDFLNALWEAICVAGGHQNLTIQPRRLLIRIALPTDPVWSCGSCRRAHQHNAGGVCTRCLVDLGNNSQPTETCSFLRERNYYAKEAAELRQPLRLHCEELTAQTDDQAQRQRHFRDIVINLGDGQDREYIKAVDEIDILSVTTTMEVGVDIGNLRAVMQANMPPMRFNYQQRVGRAGRRRQAFAVVLTLCRGRSHDEYYYNHPAKITGDKPPVPFLSMGQLQIAARLMSKEALRRAFRGVGVQWWDGPVPPDSHGEFGLVSDWQANEDRREAVRAWLEGSPEVREVAAALSIRTPPGVTQAGLETVARGELFSQIDVCAANPELAAAGLAERLAECAILPMFGMPSRTRVLYNGLREQEALTIDRDLDLAITEFAPGSQKTKDKRIYTAIGFTAPLLSQQNRFVPASSNPLPPHRWMSRCEICHYTRTSDERPTDQICPECGEIIGANPGFQVFRIVVPLAFRTNLFRGKDAKVEEEMLVGGAGSVAESDPAPCRPLPGTNSSLGFSTSGRVYRINNRRGLLFSGAVGTTFWAERRRQLEHQWIDSRYQNQPDIGVRFQPDGQTEEFGLAAPKTTDLLRIRPTAIPSGIWLDPVDYQSRASVKAAFYSAAFILRSVVAQRLDIDPEELDISDVRRVEMPDGQRTGEIIINDRLANGAGFTAWTAENWHYILEQTVGRTLDQDSFVGSMLELQHRQNCDSSCYDCLRQYRNMSYHGLLDWRLGLSLLRCLASTSFNAGLDGDFSLPELVGWPDDARLLRDSFCGAFGCTPQEFGTLSGFTVGGYEVLIVHPLWNRHVATGQLADAIAVTTPGRTRFLDTFNMLRRPSAAYQWLAE